MKSIKVWFPEFYTEAHFRRERGALELVDELRKLEIYCQEDLTTDCDFIFCGSFFKYNETEKGRKNCLHIPVIHYVWDMYPFQFEQTNEEGRLTVTASQWCEYREVIKSSVELWVPSSCTIKRVEDYTGLTPRVIKSSVEFFEEEVWDGGYVVNAMRKYPDPNENAVKEACDRLGIECRETKSYPWDLYKRTIAGCRLICSAQYEASTGGLSLLEAAYLGKPCVLSNSPRFGGREYVNGRNFIWHMPQDLDRIIKIVYDNPVSLNKKWWLKKEYSDARMASDMANRFRKLYDAAH